MNPADLETLVHRALTRLSTPGAPHTLVPRVLEAVRRRMRRPWYERSWATWPRAWQVVSLAALVALVGGIGALWPAIGGPAGELSAVVTDAASRIAGGASWFLTVANAVTVLRRALLQPVFGYLAALTALMCCAGFACGAALTRVAFGGARLP